MRTSSKAFAILLLFFLVLVIYYNASIPVFESPDELRHLAFVAWLTDEGGLPVVDPANPGPWRQEGTQPPLYYWVVAGLVGGVPHDAADRLATLNPYATMGDPQLSGNKNVVLHDLERERWPYRGTVLFVHLARVISTLMALGTLAAVYRLGRIVCPDRPWIALGMSGLVAFTPQFLFLSASANNDNLVILISAWTLVLLVSWVRGPALPGLAQLGLLGILLGLGALSKTAGLLLWPVAAATLLFLAWRARHWRWLILAGGTVLLVALALSGWWFVRNMWRYGELTGIETHLKVVGYRRQLPVALADVIGEFRGFRYSFWLLFGWFAILAPQPFYWIMDALTVLGGVGFGLFLARSLRHQCRWTRIALVILAVWLVLVAVGVLRWTTFTLASQGRLLFPALPAIALFLTVGWAELIPGRARHLGWIAAIVLWVAWAALCPQLVLKPAYALPQRVHSPSELPALPSPLGVRFGDCCELLGYIQPGGARDRPVHSGDWVPLTLVWRALNPTDQNYSVFVHARKLDGQGVGQVDTYPGNGMYPTSLWQSGEIIVDTVQVLISTTVEGPSLVRFDVGLYDLSTLEGLPAFSSDGTALEHVRAGEVALVPGEWPRPELNLPTDTVFAEKIRLAGVDLSETSAQPGDAVTVTLQWEALDRISEDYTGFVHLVDPAGKDVVQDDHPPLTGEFPTRLWFAGTVVSDPYRLDLPEDLPEGTYELRGGLYRPGSNQRLPAVAWRRGGSGDRQVMERWKDDLVHLGTLVVVRGKP